MSNYIGQKVIVRCYQAGVFYGTLEDFNSTTREARLSHCRRIWYWAGAASLSQLATEGVKFPSDSKITVSVPEMEVQEVIETIPCTQNAIDNLDAVKPWKIE